MSGDVSGNVNANKHRPTKKRKPIKARTVVIATTVVAVFLAVCREALVTVLAIGALSATLAGVLFGSYDNVLAISGEKPSADDPVRILNTAFRGAVGFSGFYRLAFEGPNVEVPEDPPVPFEYTDDPFTFADTVEIACEPNAVVRLGEEGVALFQSPSHADMTWSAGTTSQYFVMANPEGNTMAISPHIWVDVDGDGMFDPDECVYNKCAYSGVRIASYGEFIAVGRQVEDIEIDRVLDVGEYKAVVDYYAVDGETRKCRDSKEFEFNLKVI